MRKRNGGSTLKSKRKLSLQNQVLWSTAGNFVLLFSQWGISVVLARLAGFEQAGVFTLAMTIANVFAFIASYSTRHYMTSDSKGQFSRDDYIKTRIFTTILSFALCGLFLIISHYNFVNTVAILLYTVYANSTMVADVLYGCYQLGNHLEYAGYATIIKGCGCFLSFVAVMIVTNNILYAFLAMDVAAMLVLLCYEVPKFHTLFGQVSKIEKKDFRAIAALMTKCFPLMISFLLPTLITALPRMSIQQKLGETLLGVFGSIFTPTVVITTLVPSVITALVPMYSELWARKDHRQFYVRVGCMVLGVVLLGTAACAAAAILGKPVMSLLFGNDILEYFDLLYVAIIATTLCALTSCGSIFLTIIRRMKVAEMSVIVCLICVAGSLMVTVDQFGIYGAAYTLIIGYTVQLAIQYGVLVFSDRKQERKKEK